MSELRFDEVGYWSEIKLEIIKEYASAYSRILAARKTPALSHIYIDAFAGPGIHVAKFTGSFIPGSPLNALLVRPPFHEYHLIDIVPEKIDNLRSLVGDRKDVFIHQGDWQVIAAAGKMKTLDVFLNFPVADMNRNVLWRDREAVDPSQKKRLNKYWGDESWREVAYRTDGNLFNTPEKQSNEVVADAFRTRLQNVAGFAYVPEPLPMRNTRGAIVYYLYFASQKDTGEKIVTDIFRKYEEQGGM